MLAHQLCGCCMRAHGLTGVESRVQTRLYGVINGAWALIEHFAYVKYAF